MGFSSLPPGKRETHKLRAIGTGYTTLVPAPDRLWTLDSVLFVNDSASSDSVSLEIFDGTLATKLVPQHPVAAHDVYLFRDHNITLARNELLRVKSSVGAVTDVTAVGFYGTQTSS